MNIDYESAVVLKTILQTKTIKELKIERCNLTVAGLSFLLTGISSCKL